MMRTRGTYRQKYYRPLRWRGRQVAVEGLSYALLVQLIQSTRRHGRAPLLAALGVALVATACDKMQLLAPTASTITLSAPTRVLPLGETTEVSAMVLEEAGTPVQNGTTVRFSTTLGSVSPVEAQTRNGIATTTFSAGSTSGVAEVRAVSGSAGAGGSNGNGATASNVVQIQVGAASASTVLVTASPSSVPPGGGTVTIIASAIDENGNRLTGVPVSFSTTAGTLSSSTAVLDGNGEARVQLTTNSAATVTARVGGENGTIEVTLAPATSITLATAPSPAIAGQPMTLTITPATGTAPRVSVSWGDGNTQELGVVAAARSVTHTYSSPGVYAIDATAAGANGDTFSTAATVTVAPRPAPTLTVTPTSGPTTTTFTFIVTPPANTAPQNVRIEFGDGEGQDLGPITTATPVTHRYSSAGTYVARATMTESDGGSSAAAVAVTVTP